jgi:hypothetical protein
LPRSAPAPETKHGAVGKGIISSYFKAEGGDPLVNG